MYEEANITLKEVFSKAFLKLEDEWAEKRKLADKMPTNEFAKAMEEIAWQKIENAKKLAEEMGIEY